jgi:hypothetical protein
MRAGYASDPGQRFEDIRIVDNIIVGTMWNGIQVAEARGLEISGNTVLHLPGTDKVKARIGTTGATGIVHGNRAQAFVLNPEIGRRNNDEIAPATPAEVQRLRANWIQRFRRAPIAPASNETLPCPARPSSPAK